MTETASERGGRIVGREAELTALVEFLHSGGSPRAFVLTGGPGIGKTTLWEAGVDLARQRGLRVLSARGSGAETRLSSAALIDLLDGVGREELAALPLPQLRALEVALFRAEPTGTPPEAHPGFKGPSQRCRFTKRIVLPWPAAAVLDAVMSVGYASVIAEAA